MFSLCRRNRVEDFSDGSIKCGHSILPGSKDQDIVVMELNRDDISRKREFDYFSVIDGHGVDNTAAILTSEHLLDMCSDNSTDIPSNESILEGFSRTEDLVQERLLEKKIRRSGACVLSIFLSDSELKIAWVGDCSCTILSQDNVIHRTAEHRVSTNANEIQRIEEHMQSSTPRKELLEDPNWKEYALTASANGTKRRAKSFIDQRLDKQGIRVGENVLFAYEGGISLQVSRSIGDINGPRSAISRPEILCFKYTSDEISSPMVTPTKKDQGIRIIAGSDGFWDVYTAKELRKLTKKNWQFLDLNEQSHKLAVWAKNRRIARGHGIDDVSVILIHLPRCYVSS